MAGFSRGQKKLPSSRIFSVIIVNVANNNGETRRLMNVIRLSICFSRPSLKNNGPVPLLCFLPPSSPVSPISTSGFVLFVLPLSPASSLSPSAPPFMGTRDSLIPKQFLLHVSRNRLNDALDNYLRSLKRKLQVYRQSFFSSFGEIYAQSTWILSSCRHSLRF